VTTTTGEGDDAVTTSTCTAVEITADSYYIYKCSDDGCVTDDLTSITSSDKVAIYKGKSGNIVEQITTGSYYDSSKLLLCESTGECKLPIKDGYYIHPTETSKLIQCTVTNGNPSYTVIDSITEHTYYGDASTQETSGSTTTYTNLIHCSSSDGTISCESKAATTIGTGYFVNKDATENSLDDALFSCDSSKCTVITPTTGTYYVNAGSDSNATTKNTIIICNSSSGCQTSNGTAGYYLDEGNKGDDNTYSKLIHCTTETGQNAITTCTPNDSITPGYYLDGSDSTGKKIIECSEATKCQSKEVSSIDEGYYMNGSDDNTNHLSNDIIYCSGLGDNKACEPQNGVDNGYYINSGFDKNDKPLIHCVSTTGCETVSALEGYYINEPSMVEDSNPVTYKELLYCKTESGKISCIKAETIPITDYIIDSGTLKTAASNSQPATFTQLIQCSGSDDDILCSSNPPTSIGYYIDGSVNSNIIQCKEANSVKICSSITHGGSGTSQKHYFGANGIVITCTTQCFLEDATIKGYFLNAGSMNKPLIKCPGTGSESCTEDTASSFDGIGSAKVASNVLSICISTGCSGNGLKTTAAESYETFGVEASKFPGISEKKTISVKIGTDGTIIYLEPASLPTCNNTSGIDPCVTNKPEQYCIGSDKKIYSTTVSGDNTSCSAITSESPLYFNNDFIKLDSAPTDNTPNIMAYQCINDTCELAKGYVNIGTGDNTKVIQCSGWKREGCVVTDINTTTTCEATDTNGKLTGDGKTVCYTSTTSPTLPTDDNSSYVAFQASAINSVYGIEKDEIVFLEMTQTSVLVTTSTGKILSINKFIIKI